MTSQITIVGGLYGERCAFPRQDLVRGSGGRAALLMRSCGLDVRLVTACDEIAGDAYAAIATPRGIALDLVHRPNIVFDYAHPLAVPRIYPLVSPILNWRHSIGLKRGLVFGMVEGRPCIEAEQVVYDPQDGVRSQLFHVNGSLAKRLVYVLNLGELFSITGESAIDMALVVLKELAAPEAVVIKLGPEGVLVSNAAGDIAIDAWPTRAVWKIGSGDVFSAAFAARWLSGENEVAAAKFASRAVAEYVFTQADYFSVRTLERVMAEAVRIRAHPWVNKPKNRLKVYLAGPFFTTAQQWFVDEIKQALEQMHLDVFSPIHDVGEGPASVVAAGDLKGLEQADIVFAVLDGCDAGTLFEVGWAAAHKKPVIGLLESPAPHITTMIEGTGAQIFSDLASAVYATAWIAVAGNV